MDNRTIDVPLSAEAERLYLNYALSVITARALPDVRDGLKPVQRRILFTMFHELRLAPDHKPAKCARIVGDVMGKYHPHGDSAIYDTLVRMAQDWVMRSPLVQGQGNFGSIDGDAPAAYRYTEAKLAKLALELLSELGQKTVPYRPNFDATKFEPVVLPARFPNLLVNGAQGIAVGMATSIPPHNLEEVCDALDSLAADPEISIAGLMKKLKGPDFPTGGEIVSSRTELRQIYETGQGSIKVRGQWKPETINGAACMVITSIPYNLEKRTLVEKIAEVIVAKKLPPLVDVRDESTDVVRVVLELKKGANPDLVMAYLQKHTPLLSNIQVNLTCLTPSAAPDVAVPRRLNLKEMLQYFLDFRFEIITKRLSFELDELNKRLHILDGFEAVFDALDEIIRIIRRSEGKQDAADKIMKRFKLDELQTDAILELKLYRLAKLEILVIQQEAEKKRKEAARLSALLKSDAKRWNLVRTELSELKASYGDRRRTRIVGQDDAPEFSATDFIIEEDAIVIVTEQGWVKRQQRVKDLTSTRLKDGDRVLACVAGSTRASVAFFSSAGSCYVARIADLPASTGYGDPVQKMFKFADGERVVGVFCFDRRVIELPEEEEVYEDGTPCPPYAVAITKQGLALRFPVFTHKDPSTRTGRRFARLKDGDEVITVFPEEGQRFVIAAADDGHGIAVELSELSILAGPGKGTQLMKLGTEASLIAAVGAPSPRTGALVVLTDKGRRYELFAEALLTTRGGRGKPVVKRAQFASAEWPLPAVPDLSN